MTGGREPGREGSLVRGDEAAKRAGSRSRASPVADVHGGFPVAGRNRWRAADLPAPLEKGGRGQRVFSLN